MRPKGKLFALMTIFVAIGLISATGAFTTVSAERTAEVNVAGDATALLQLQPHDGPNGQGGYAQMTNDELTINFDGVSGAGPNLNATTDIQGVFNVTNQGTDTVHVNISDSGTNNDLVTFYNSSMAPHASNGLETDGGGTGAELGVGETVTVSIYIDTDGEVLGDGDELVNQITIYATTDGASFTSTTP